MTPVAGASAGMPRFLSEVASLAAAEVTPAAQVVQESMADSAAPAEATEAMAVPDVSGDAGVSPPGIGPVPPTTWSISRGIAINSDQLAVVAVAAVAATSHARPPVQANALPTPWPNRAA